MSDFCSENISLIKWSEIFKVLREKKSTNLGFHSLQNYPSKVKKLTLSQTNKNHCRSTCLERNGKRSSLQTRKIIQIRNSDLHRERKNIKDGISESKIKIFIFLILN